MNVIGIIAEYNPFHLGHKYQIKKIKEMYQDSIIIAIVSTHFTQRGDISIINKWNKTKICLYEGIDLVIELPTLFATQSADIFAHGALSILSKFKIDTLIFGSESNDVNMLVNLANIELNNSQYDKLVKKYLSTGINYPTAMSKSLKEITKIDINSPNDLLALSYIKEIIKNNYAINPVSIQRTNDYHDMVLRDNNIINATLIRKLLLDNKEINKYIPEITNKYIYHNLSLDNAYKYLIYAIINNRNKLQEYLEIDSGLEGRILKYYSVSKNWNELVINIKTKRYTYNKINRALIHILLNIKKNDNECDEYLRILGFNTRGRNYLNKIKKDINVPVFTNYKNGKSKLLDLEYYSTYIYSLIINNVDLIKKEKDKPIIVK